MNQPEFSRASILSIAMMLLGGICMGSFPPLSKLAVQNGIPEYSYMLHAAAGGALGLGVWVAKFDRFPTLNFTYIKYSAFTAITAYVIPSILTVFAVTKVGASLVAMTFTLVPVLAYIFTLLLGLEKVQSIRIIGICFGFIGVLTMALHKFSLDELDATVWVLAALIIPVSLAVSTAYRTLAWPEGFSPSQLALGMLAFSAIMLAFISVWNRNFYIIFWSANSGNWIVLLQMVTACLSYQLVFKVQRDNGPVFQSLMGYISMATGVVVGLFVYGEDFSKSLWFAFAFLIMGMYLVNRKLPVP